MRWFIKLSALFLTFSLPLLWNGCTTSENKETDLSSIDPNAPALPPEETISQTPADVAATPPTSETLATPPPVSPSTVKEETFATPPPVTDSSSSSSSPVTPPVEELTAAPTESSEDIGTLDDNGPGATANVPAKAKVAKTSDGRARVFGTGKRKRYIKADQLHIRTQPDRFSKSIGLIYGGDEVHVTIRGDWAKLEEGQWIRSRWLVKNRPRKFQEDKEQLREPTKKIHKKSKKRAKAKKKN